MPITIINPQFQTLIFGTIFLLILAFSVRRAKKESFFAPSTTESLKGFAILAIIFSHIGYSLSSQSFLYPFSILAGVGVNLFLFLSGFGLASSALHKPLSILAFYKKRLPKLFLPMWFVLIIYLLLDYFVLAKTYPPTTIFQSFLGFFPVADLFTNINSPLWYFSLILYFYLLFPLLFWKKYRFLSPFIMLAVTFYFLRLTLPINRDVITLYKLHFVSFPLGILLALIINNNQLYKIKINFLKVPLLFIAVIIFLYTAIHSNIGQDAKLEQGISIITTLSLVIIFILLSWETKVFNFFGKYSYEIYLLHWPLLSRYDLLYKNLSASLATLLYLILFLFLAWLLNKIIRKIFFLFNFKFLCV